MLAGKEDEIIQEQLKAGVILESTSPWASPMVYVMKTVGTIRHCVDSMTASLTLTSRLGLDDMSLAWPAVVQLLVGSGE